MSERQCCVCKRERCVAVVCFPLLREGYPMGDECHASWTIEATALGRYIGNPSKVLVAFRRWMDGRAA
jgi:hypothetical protein